MNLNAQDTNELDIIVKKLHILRNKMDINDSILDGIERDLVSLNLASFVLTQLSIKYLKDFTLFNIIANYSLDFYRANIDKNEKLFKQYYNIREKNEKYAHRFLKIAGKVEYMKSK